MASSDDEADVQPLFVSNYHFVDDRDVPVSFSVLPIQWSESESLDSKKGNVFLHGFADNGLQKIFKQVIAWSFDLSYVKPEISVLSKEGRWVKLQRPRKSYGDTIRTILITVHFLHYVKKNPDISAKSMWDSLSKNKEFSSYEVMPSQNDLLDHMALLGEAAKRDAVLAKSKLLLMVLEDKNKARIKKLSDEEVKDLARPGFIIDDVDNDAIHETAEESDEEEDLFDSVCSFCDNGGELLICDGKCMRSFHACEEDGDESSCVSLGFTRKEVDEIQNFYCKNCEYNQHQCFACGKLGCSDKFSGAEVFKCASATCGFFYHPQCVAKLLHRVVEDASVEPEKNIARGDPFTCPAHYCYICKEMENKQEHDLQFAVCRRCPKSYHRKCLPRKIAFEDNEDEDIVARAWEGLLPNNRILIYCLKHEIDDEIGTPIRDHIKFPNVKATVREINTDEKTKPVTKERAELNKKDVELDNLHARRTSAKETMVSCKMSSEKVGMKKFGNISGSNIARKKANEASKRRLNENKRLFLKETKRSDHAENQPSLGSQLYGLYMGTQQANSHNRVDDVAANTLSVKSTKRLSRTSSQLDADSERRLLALFNEATSSVTLENVIREHKFASTHAHSLKHVVEKTITAGKLEASVEAVRTALRMLGDGQSIRDAEAVCGPDVLNQLFKWKDKLKVYLAPVLYGNRYTSFGRHFTQVEKLEGIVDKLQWYVQNGDTIVDFCCGANDFSILLKKKLEETGKICSYKNYDLLPTKNDFNFEMRDWMTVQKKELPTGSRLIMGLNPPFGIKAYLANKFIDKALEFKPKLLILIVPSETERLDKKRSPYDLVWEDEKFLSGKSFYLPGSVDTNDKQLGDWNVKTPPLYLWSHPDWTDKHKVIAQKHGHLSSKHKLSKVESSGKEKSHASQTMNDNYADGLMMGHDRSNSINDDDQHSASEGQTKSSSYGNIDRESQERYEYLVSSSGNVDRERHERQDYLSKKSKSTSLKRKQTEKNGGRQLAATSPAKRQAISELFEGELDHGISNPLDVDRFQPKSSTIPNIGVVDNSNRNLEPHASSHLEFGAARNGTPNPLDVDRFKPKSSTIPNIGVVDISNRNLEPHASSHLEFGAARNGTPNWLNATDPLSDYRARDVEETHSRLVGDGKNNRPYIREDDRYLRELETRQQIHHQGLLNPDSIKSNYLPGHDPVYNHMGPTYSVFGSGSNLSYATNAPAMQRYAPRLNEFNHVGTDNLVSEPPIIGRNGAMLQPGYGNGLQGFAAGSPQMYSRRNSTGRFNQ